ncbi:MAG: (2Fe-2S)-binding protein [Planctomycetes bacterium]|nr:(2Fe-2S)-binding protein [Planctomycetota bacterium]
MPRVTIDGQTIDGPAGKTILWAAKQLGIAIPTLCHAPRLPASASCLACVVRVVGRRTLVPACAMPIHDGMEVVTDSPEIRAARRVAVELLLSDHLGECLAPCELACPLHWDIPAFMAALRNGDLSAAAAVAREGLALPGVLGCICSAPCEKVCRRGDRDGTVQIRRLHQYAGTQHHQPVAVKQPADQANSGRKRVAVIGAGPAGLAAAHNLARLGYSVTVFDAAAKPGGSLLALGEELLPAAVLDADVAAIAGMGVRFELNVRAGGGVDVGLSDLRGRFDAVVLAVGGKSPIDWLAEAGLPVAAGRVHVDAHTRAVGADGLFAAGACTGRANSVVRAVADGMAAGESVAQFLSGAAVTGPARRAVVRYGPLAEDETEILWSGAEDNGSGPSPVSDDASAFTEAGRCLLCGCWEKNRCRLRQVATELGAKTTRYVGQRRRLSRDQTHVEVVFEPHKCILCGACVQLSRQVGDGPGLTFVGRGLATRVSAAYEGSMADALGDAAGQIAEICPTGAFYRKRTSKG